MGKFLMDKFHFPRHLTAINFNLLSTSPEVMKQDANLFEPFLPFSPVSTEIQISTPKNNLPEK
jgi:hypothetical protein